MKLLHFLAFAFMWSPAFSQVNVSINVSSPLRTLSGNELGINTDYLMDDGFIIPGSATSTTNALKKMGIKMLRYPGGEKSDNYLFSATPWISSSPRMALTDAACYWPTNDPNFVNLADPNKACKSAVLDFDEFMDMCTGVQAQPLIVVAYDGIYNTSVCAKPTKTQLITHAVEWVRYANITKGYNVKYWMIGNESWKDPTYNGQTTPAQYAIDINDFANAMRAVDPTIKIIANGKSGWWQTLLQSSAAANIDFLGYSEYPADNYTGGYDYYRTNDVNLTAETNAAINDIVNYASSADKKRIKVIPTEFNSIDFSGQWTNENNLGHALANFQIFGDLIVKPEVETACMWNTRWVTNISSPQDIKDALDANGNLNATGLAQFVWSKVLLQAMVSTTGNSTAVRVFAGYDSVLKKLHIAMLNKESSAMNINLTINNYVSSFAGTRWEMRGSSPNDKFPTYTQMGVINTPSDISSVTIPANAITILQLENLTVVPIQLLSFTGKRQDTSNLLNWKVGYEINLSRYEVERSSRANTNFSVIGSVKSHDLPNENLYSFTDVNSKNGETFFYRLKMVNNDEKYRYSGIIKIEGRNNKSNFNFHVLPNTVKDEINLQIASDKKRVVTMQVFQNNGQLVLRKIITVEAGTNTYTFQDNAVIRPGIYAIEINDAENKKVARFIKL